MSTRHLSKDVTITIGKVKSHISGDFPFSKLSTLLSYYPKGFKFMHNYKKGFWDGRIRLMTLTGVFPSGLYPMVREFLRGEEIKFNRKFVYRINKFSTSGIKVLDKTELRNYQIQAVTTALQHGRGILKLPAGAGKTLIAASVINTIKVPTIFLTHKKDLLYQTRDVFQRELSTDIGLIGDQHRTFSSSKIDIVSIPTISRDMDRFKAFLESKELLIADEVHHASSNTWYQTIMKIPAAYRYGLTATPYVGGKSILLEGCTGPIIYSANNKHLMAEGYLAEPKVFFIKMEKPKINRFADYHVAYKAGIVENKVRNVAIAKLCKKLLELKLLPVCVMVKTISHGKSINTQLRLAGMKSVFVHGVHSGQQRAEVIDLTKLGKIDVLVTSPIFGEGVDIPSLRSVIIASGGYSVVKVIQDIGRGMRVAKGKEMVLVVDFLDLMDPYLLKHSKARKRIYKSESYSTSTTTLYDFLSLSIQQLLL